MSLIKAVEKISQKIRSILVNIYILFFTDYSSVFNLTNLVTIFH